MKEIRYIPVGLICIVISLGLSHCKMLMQVTPLGYNMHFSCHISQSAAYTITDQQPRSYFVPVCFTSELPSISWLYTPTNLSIKTTLWNMNIALPFNWPIGPLSKDQLDLSFNWPIGPPFQTTHNKQMPTSRFEITSSLTKMQNVYIPATGSNVYIDLLACCNSLLCSVLVRLAQQAGSDDDACVGIRCGGLYGGMTWFCSHWLRFNSAIMCRARRTNGNSHAGPSESHHVKPKNETSRTLVMRRGCLNNWLDKMRLDSWWKCSFDLLYCWAGELIRA